LTRLSLNLSLESVQPEELSRIAWVRSLAKSGAAKSIRVAAGVSLPEAARAVPCAVSTYWRWEHGERVPSTDLALPYATVLETLLEKR
jgi:DNA-binding transcriptional regulator YiaG